MTNAKDPYSAKEEFDAIMAQTLSDANAKINEETTRLMDIQHETIQHSRNAIRELRGYAIRFEESIMNVIIAHAMAAKEMADLYGDVIAGELGIEDFDESEDEEEETEDGE